MKKKVFWIICSTVLILGLFYGRIFFIQTPETGTEKAVPKNAKTTPNPPSKHTAEINPVKTIESSFPSKSEPLTLPAYNWPPFSMKDESGRWIGADIEITEAVMNQMGYKVNWIEMAFARALEEMRSANYPGMAPCVVGGGREEYIMFSEPVSSIYSVLWKKKKEVFSWQTYDDLKGRVIGASYYHYGAGFFDAAKAGKFQVDMVASKTPELVHFRKLIEGKTDMFICELSVGLYLRHQYSPEFDSVDYCPTGVGPTRPFCFAVSKKYFEGKEEQLKSFVLEFNRELTLFAKQGERKTIFDKYHMLVKTDDQGRIIVPGGDTQPK